MAKKAKPQTEADKPADPADIAACAAEYSKLMGQRARLDQHIGAMFERYKTVKAAAIKRDYRRRNMTEAEIKAEVAEDVLYTKVLKSIVWDAVGQSSLAAVLEVPSTAKAALAVARAHADGYNSGKAGGTIDACPFPAGSEEFISWRDGWSDGWEDHTAGVIHAKPRRRAAESAAGHA